MAIPELNAPRRGQTTVLQLLTAGDRMTAQYNEDDIGLDEYKEAARRSSVLRYALDYRRTNIARRLASYQNEDERVEEWVKDRCWPAVKQAMVPLLGADYYGNVLAEVIPDLSDAEGGIRRVRVADPEVWWSGSVTRDQTTRDVMSWTLIDGREAQVKAKDGRPQIIQWARGADWDNAFGDPIARRAYVHYWTLKQLLAWEGIGCETAALPRVILFTNTDSDTAQSYCETLTQLGTNGAAALPEGTVMNHTILPSAFAGGSPYEEVIRRHVSGMFAAFGVPPLVLAEANFGTRAQASTQLEAWIGTETSGAEELRDQVLLPQIIRPAIERRFGPNVERGTITVNESSPPDLGQLAQIVQVLFTIGAFRPELETQLRQLGEWFDYDVDELIEAMKRGDLAEPGVDAGGTA